MTSDMGANSHSRGTVAPGTNDAFHAAMAALLTVQFITVPGNAAVLPLLRAHLRPSARVVSYCWGLPDLPPTRTAQALGRGVVLQFPNVLLWERAQLFDDARSRDG